MTLGVGIAAVNTANNLLFLVLGLLLSLILLSGVLSDLVLFWIEAERRPPLRLFARAPVPIEIVLTNRKRFLPSFSVEVEDVALEGDNERRCYFLKVPADGHQAASYRRVVPERGVFRFSHVRLSTRYPFGFFDKWRYLRLPGEVVVFPAIVDVESLADELVAQGELSLARERRAEGLDVAGLRDYREGDDGRAVHGRRSASLGRLVVKEREPEGGRHAVLQIDNGIGEGAPPAAREALERAISEAASLAVLANERGIELEVVARGARGPGLDAAGAIDPLLTWLALLDVVDPSIPFAEPRRRGPVVPLGLAPEGLRP